MHPPVSFLSFVVLLLCYLSFSQSYLTVPEDILEYESEWAVQLNDDNPEFLEKEGFIIERKVEGLKGIYIIKDKVTQDNNTRSRFAPSPHVDRRLSSLSSIVWAEQQYKTKWSKRETEIKDPLYSSQWHLHNTGQFQGLPNIDINVINAWDNGYTGAGVRIAIVDDGYQTTHPDLAPNYKADSSYSFNNPIGNSPDPDVTIDFHGTAAAGVAFAAPNSICGVGAAYTAWGAGIRLISDSISDATTAEGLTYKNQLNDIYSNSWGPPDTGIKVGGPGKVTKAALQQSVISGRGGKGSIYVWAAGNGGAVDDNCNYDGYSTAPETIAIGALGNNGVQSFYSEPCAALLVSAPSSSANENAGIRTSDLIGIDGYYKDSCTPSFGGTSSSCPLVAGIIALMLQANPKLGWRDVPIILAQTAVKVDEDDVDWEVNGAGHHVNHKYGFGLVDASAAVQAAKKHKNVPEEKTAQSSVVTVSQVIPDFPAQGVEFKINIEESFAIEKVILSVSIDHKTSGDLQVELKSPSGTNSVMSTPHAFVSALYLGNTPYPVANAAFGARVSVEGVSGPLVAASPNTACTQVTNCNALKNSITVVYATDCGGQRFTATAKTIQNCGAKAMIMVSDEAINMNGNDPTITIVVISVGRDAVSAMVQGATATIRLAQYLVNNYVSGWSFKTVRPLGESPKGTWTLKITDGFKGQTGTLNSYSLTVYGAGKPKSKGSNTAVVVVAVIFSLLFVGLIAGCSYVYYKKGNLFGCTYTKGIGIHKMSQVSGYVPYVDRG